jgi:hypothetical protein
MGFVSGEASLVEKHVSCPDDLVECLCVPTGIGVATAPSLSVKRADDLLSVGASRHTQNFVRIAPDSLVNVIAHR